MDTLRLLTPELALDLRQQFGTPLYAYDLNALEKAAAAVLAFPNAYGLTARFAMKACPNATILRALDRLGLHFDASSVWEVRRALRAGIAAHKISLSTQELPNDFVPLVQQGLRLNACSLHQLERYGQAFPNTQVGLRINPGLGSGSTGKTNVGGPDSSFGIWHELLDQAQAIASRHSLTLHRIHTHIGSGSDPAVWERVAHMSLALARQLPEVTTLNLGGGYKVARMPHEKTTDLQAIGRPIRAAFEQLASETGRRLHLEIEPGTYLVANAGCLVATIQDIATTPTRTFLKLDTGMTEILRPSLYAAQHPIIVIPSTPTTGTHPYTVVGHCCESGDLLTPHPDAPDTLAERELHTATIGDLCVIEGTGAYCAAMPAKNYNSFPEAPEVLVDRQGHPHLIRRRQTLEQLLQNELSPPEL